MSEKSRLEVGQMRCRRQYDDGRKTKQMQDNMSLRSRLMGIWTGAGCISCGKGCE
jgi:hypothetical protein